MKGQTKNQWYSNRNFWLILWGVASLFVIFFVGKTTTDTGSEHFALSTNGVREFRLGMDIAGGIVLRYKLDFSQYRAIYTDTAMFQQVRKQTLQTIQQTIEKRVLNMGVGDATVVVQTIDDVDYIVVSVGGILDEDTAKEMIGKTVQLRFAVPAKSSNDDAVRRRTVAQSLVNVSGSLKSGYDALSISDAIYGSVENSDFTRLPMIYQENIDRFATIQAPARVFLEGPYDISLGQDGSLITTSGYVVADISAIQPLVKETITADDAYRTLDTQSIATTIDTIINNSLTGNTELYDGSTFLYPIQEQHAGVQAYRLRFAQIDTTIITDPITQEEILNTFTSGTLTPTSGLTIQYSEPTRESIVTLGTLIPGLDGNTTGVRVIQGEGKQYLVDISESKAADQKLWQVISATLSPEEYATFSDAVRKSYRVSLEEVFVPFSPVWQTAIDPKTQAVLDSRYFQAAAVTIDTLGNPVVSLRFNDEGRQIFCNITEAFVNQQIAIFVGDTKQPITAPVVNEKICGGEATISGGFDREAAQKLAADLNDGAFPVAMILESEDVLSPILGYNALYSALISGVIGFVLIAIYLFIMYGTTMGFVGIGTLTIYFVLLLGFLKLFDYPFSLSGIAAIIIALGMAVDANILIFERVRDDSGTDEGKRNTSIVTAAVDKSRSAIKDGNISTGIIALVMMLSGIAILQGFGTMLVITIAFTLIVNVYVTKQLLLLAVRRK